MKKIFYTVAIALLMVGVATAQTAKKKVAKKAEKEMIKQEVVDGPKITFESTVMDYGEIEKGADPLRKFSFVNDGTEPLVIKSAKGSCGCTVPDWPKEPILPGETGSIDVRYDTNRIGTFSKSVTLTTNIGDEKIVLNIKGKVNALPKEESVPAKEGTIF